MQITITPPIHIPLPDSHILKKYENEPSPKDGFMFAICPICSKVQDDVLVSKKFRAHKIIFCSTKCASIFQDNVKIIRNVENKEDKPKENQLKQAYTNNKDS